VKNVVALLVLPTALVAQSPSTSYEQTYRELMNLVAREDRAAQVTNLVLTRDAARFSLTNGVLYLLRPVNGRTVGAVWKGAGAFTFVPRTQIERDRLARFEHTPTLDVAITGLVLFFSDRTAAELESKLRFSQGEGGLGNRVRDALNYLGDEDSKTIDPDLMGQILNADSSGFFYAHIERDQGGPLMFAINPFEVEGVTLAKRAPRTAWTREPEVLCQFPPRQTPLFGIAGDRRRTATINDYKIDVTLATQGGAGIAFSAAANVTITSDSGVGPWVAFTLFPKLVIDSARWAGAGPATVFRGKEAGLLWIMLDKRLAPGETRTLILGYHGALIDRYGDFFYILDEIGWYPRSLAGRSKATFDLTFHAPSHYLLASVGNRISASVEGRVSTTHWVTPEPIRNAAFNLGLFDDYRIEQPGVPPVTVMINEDAHAAMGKMFLQEGATELLPQRHMKETVGNDLVQSLKFFRHVYGPPPVEEFYATETPYPIGLAFPGLVHLSWTTFQLTDQKGQDEVFRAHEVAHQWWGISVDFATYHDQWLSEAFAEFSGLWYLHTARRDNDSYLGLLRRYRREILERREEPSPIWLGYRASSSKDPAAYGRLIYQKGAWVLHMLRIMMLDLGTAKEDKFTQMLEDFYATYRGGHASTEDFQQVVESHRGAPMDWFFNQWVYGTGIPTYRVAYKTEPAEGGQYRVRLRIEQQNVPPDFQMPVPVSVELADKRWGRYRVNVRGPLTEVALPLVPSQPKSVKFNDLEAVLADVKMVDW